MEILSFFCPFFSCLLSFRRRELLRTVLYYCLMSHFYYFCKTRVFEWQFSFVFHFEFGGSTLLAHETIDNLLLCHEHEPLSGMSFLKRPNIIMQLNVRIQQLHCVYVYQKQALRNWKIELNSLAMRIKLVVDVRGKRKKKIP